MPFCYAPWTNLDISTAGEIAPCCKFQRKYYNETFNVNSVVQYFSSSLLNSIKQSFRQNQWPKGCERCRIEEESNICSKRQHDWLRWRQHYKKYDLDSSKLLTASIAFGNTCNLACITCNSHTSSRWRQEYQTIYQIDYPHVRFYQQHFIEQFVDLAPNLIHLDIPGGEPFISGVAEQQKLLQYYIDSGQASDITLHYTTNGTIYPNKVWWDLWKNFHEIDLQLSIDGIGPRYEYIRFPASWSILNDNIDRYLNVAHSNFRISVSHTVSAYNVYYISEFIAWCRSVKLPEPWLGRVHTPVHMRPSVWPDPVRKLIAQHLSSSNDLATKSWADLMLTNNDSEYFEMFKMRLREHDKYRNTNFEITFPELAEFVR